MRRSLLVAVLAAAGCVAPVEGPEPDAIPLGGWGDDDDAVAEPSVHSNVPDGPTTEGFSLEPCTIGEVLAPDCSPVEFVAVELTVGPDCPVGEQTVVSAEDWAQILAECGVESDAGDAIDWDAEALQVHVGEGTGCSCSHEVMWVAQCDDGPHVGAWFYPCGPCDDVFVRLTAASVPRDGGPPALELCTPYDVRCIH